MTMRTKQWLTQKLKEEPGLALSLGYLCLTLIGLTYQWELLRRFGVNRGRIHSPELAPRPNGMLSEREWLFCS